MPVRPRGAEPFDPRRLLSERHWGAARQRDAFTRLQRIGHLRMSFADRYHPRNDSLVEPLESRTLLATAFVGSPTVADASSASSSSIKLASRPNGFIATWTRSGVPGSVHRAFDWPGVPVGDEVINLHNGTGSASQLEQIAADAAGNFVSVWGETSSGASVIAYRLFGADGVPKTDRTVVRQFAEDDAPSVAMADDGRFVIVWTDDEGSRKILLQRFSAAGAAVGSPIQINTLPGFQLANNPDVDISADGNTIAVAFSERVIGGIAPTQVHAARLDGSGNFLVTDSRVSPTSLNASVGLSCALADNGNLLLAFGGLTIAQPSHPFIYLQSIDAAGAMLTNPSIVARVQAAPIVDFDGNAGVVTWTASDSSGTGVFARLFAGDGSPLGSKFLANAQFQTNGQSVNAVLVQEDRILIGWTGTFPTSSGRAGYQAFDQSGSAKPIELTSAALELDGDFGGGLRGQRLNLQFSRAYGSFEIEDLALSNLTTTQLLDPFYMLIQGGAGADQIFISQRPSSSFAPIKFDDGNWRLAVSRFDLGDSLGNPIAKDLSIDFHILDADANHDRHVDALDQAIVNANLGGTNKKFIDGDFNYDGKVDQADQAILAAQLSLWLPPQGPLELPSTSAADTYVLQRLGNELRVRQAIDIPPLYRVPLGAITALSFDGGDGADSITILGTPAADQVTFDSGSVIFDGVQMTLANVEARGFDGQRGLDSLTIHGGTVVSVSGTQVLGFLSIDAGTTLDLNDQSLIIDYTAASPLASLSNQIRSARNNGTWTGPGITSTVARNNPFHNTTLGAIEASEFKIIYGTNALFSGQPIDTTMVLVKYTYYGDTDFNGVVDFDDYSRIDAGFNKNRSGWLNGDVDGNGIVDFDDYSLIDQAFNTQGSGLRPALPPLGNRPAKGGGVRAR